MDARSRFRQELLLSHLFPSNLASRSDELSLQPVRAHNSFSLLPSAGLIIPDTIAGMDVAAQVAMGALLLLARKKSPLSGFLATLSSVTGHGILLRGNLRILFDVWQNAGKKQVSDS